MSVAEYVGVTTGFVALLVSLYTLYRDKFYFRGSAITLANDDVRQRSIVLKYSNVPATLRDSFVALEDRDSRCAIVRIAWLNTGDRASYVYLSALRVLSEADGRSYPFFALSYTDVEAGSGVFQPVLVYGLDIVEGTLAVQVEYVWHRLTPKGARVLGGTATLVVDLVDEQGLTSMERRERPRHVLSAEPAVS